MLIRIPRAKTVSKESDFNVEDRIQVYVDILSSDILIYGFDEEIQFLSFCSRSVFFSFDLTKLNRFLCKTQ